MPGPSPGMTAATPLAGITVEEAVYTGMRLPGRGLAAKTHLQRLVNRDPTFVRFPLVSEQIANNNERSRNKELAMLRTVLVATAEITSLATFGTMVAIWALILAPGA
jgi:hypothetical protein